MKFHEVLTMLDMRVSRADARRLILIRHAAVEERHLRLDDELLDPALSATGRNQAEIAVAGLDAFLGARNLGQIQLLATSPMLRAIETAAYFSEHLSLPVEIVRNLREIELYPDHYGIPCMTAEGETAVVEAIEAFASHGIWGELPFAESTEHLHARIHCVLEMADRRLLPGGVCLAVSHGALINAIVAQALGLTTDYFAQLPNCSITMLSSSEPSNWRVDCIGA